MLVVGPAVGPLVATLAEIPLMLWIAWIACGRIVARLSVPALAGARIAMGAVGFLLLMAMEAALAIGGFGRSPADVVAAFGTPDGAIGLAAQIAFAVVPLARIPSART